MTKGATRFESGIARGLEYLRSLGCREVILFGSAADGSADSMSDIDFAVSGISSQAYFSAAAVLPSIVGRRVDLVLLGHVSSEFERRIRATGKTLYAAAAQAPPARTRPRTRAGGARAPAAEARMHHPSRPHTPALTPTVTWGALLRRGNLLRRPPVFPANNNS